IATATEGSLIQIYAKLAALAAQSHDNWEVAIIGSEPAQRRADERAEASDQRISWFEAAADETVGAAERRAATALAGEWLVLPAPGAVLHRHAVAWFAAAAGEGTAHAFVSDEESLGEEGGGEGAGKRRAAPQLRHAVDYD